MSFRKKSKIIATLLVGKVLLLSLAIIGLILVFGCDDKSKSVSVATTTTITDTTFQGSATCKTCHKAIYDKWVNSGHNKKFQLTSNPPGVIADGNANGQNDFKDGITLGTLGTVDADWASKQAAGTAPVLGWDSATDAYSVTMAGEKFSIDYTLGGHRWKQRYVTKVGSGLYVLPIQFNQVNPDLNVLTGNYVVFHGSDWYNGDDTFKGTAGFDKASRSWYKNCLACHTTAPTDIKQDANGIWVASFGERSITCEGCHGPAAQHVSLGGGVGTIVNPEKLGVIKGNQVCAGCHVRGKSTKGQTLTAGNSPNGTHGYPWSATENRAFRPGDEISDFYTFLQPGNSSLWPDTFDTAKSHHQQYLDFKRDKHYKAGLTCWSCHDPHGSTFRSDLRYSPDRNDLCLTCHGPNKATPLKIWNPATGGDVANSLLNHTHHNVSPSDPTQPTVGNGSLCISCHYPYTAKSGVKYDIRAHTAKIVYPYESGANLASGMPNSCMNGNCHTAKDNSTNKWSAGTTADLNSATAYIGRNGGGGQLDDIAPNPAHFGSSGIVGNVAPRAYIFPKDSGGGLAFNFSLSGASGLPAPSNMVLDGGRSHDSNRLTTDTNATELSYSWFQLSGPETLTLNATQTNTITISTAGTYVIRLIVADQATLSLQSDPFDVTIYVRP